MITLSMSAGIFAAVLGGGGMTPTDAPVDVLPVIRVAEQADDTPTRNTVDLLSDIIANANSAEASSARVAAPADAIKLVDPRALTRPQLRPGSGTQLTAMQADLPSGTNQISAQPAAADNSQLAEETAAARAAINGQSLAPAQSAIPDKDNHATHNDHDDHGMMMTAPDPNLSACVNEIKTVANRTTIYFNSSSSALDKRSREAAFLLASMVQKCPEARVMIVEFTDPKGDPAINLALSWKRANTVLNTIKSGGFSTQPFTVKSHMQKHNGAVCPHWDVVDRHVEFVVKQAH